RGGSEPADSTPDPGPKGRLDTGDASDRAKSRMGWRPVSVLRDSSSPHRAVVYWMRPTTHQRHPGSGGCVRTVDPSPSHSQGTVTVYFATVPTNVVPAQAGTHIQKK